MLWRSRWNRARAPIFVQFFDSVPAAAKGRCRSRCETFIALSLVALIARVVVSVSS
jgi:hypothetical protein